MGYVVESRFNPVLSPDGQTQGRNQAHQRNQPQQYSPQQCPPWTPTRMGGHAPTDAKTMVVEDGNVETETPHCGPDTGVTGFSGDGIMRQNSELNYESVVVLNANNNTFANSTIRGTLHNHQMTVTSMDSTTPAGKLRKMKRDAKRLVFKDGSCNISHCNIQERRRKYLADLFTTLIDIRWRWSFFIFFSSFVFRWVR